MTNLKRILTNLFVSTFLFSMFTNIAYATVIISPETRKNDLINLFSTSLSVVFLVMFGVGVLLTIISKISPKLKLTKLFVRTSILGLVLFGLTRIGLFVIDAVEEAIHSSDTTGVDRLNFINYSTLGLFLSFGAVLLIVYKFIPKVQKKESKIYLLSGGIITVLSTLMLLVMFIWNPQ